MGRRSEIKKHWVKKEDLDTPLCEVFPDTKTNGTARQWVAITEFVLGVSPCNLDKMNLIEINKYMDSLDKQLMKIVI